MVRQPTTLVLHTERLSLSVRVDYLSIYLSILYIRHGTGTYNCTRKQAPERPPPSARQLKSRKEEPSRFDWMAFKKKTPP